MYDREVKLLEQDGNVRWFYRGATGDGRILLRESHSVGEAREGKPRGHKPRNQTPLLHRVHPSEIKGAF